MTLASHPSLQLLGTYLRPQRGRAALLAVLLLGSTGLQLGGPRVLRQFIDQARGAGPIDMLTYTALLYLLVVLVGQALETAVVYLGADVGWAATNMLRADLLEHVLGLGQSFHAAHTPGELIQRVDGDVAALANFFSQFVVRVLGSLLLSAGAIGLLLWDDWRLGLGMLALALAGALALHRLQGFAVRMIKAHRQSFAELSGFWEERLLGTEDLRGIGALPYTMRRHAELLGAHMQRARLGNTAGRIMQSAGELLVAGATAAMFALSAYLLFGGSITLGTVYLVFAYADMLAWNVLLIAQQLDDLQQATAGLQRIGELRAVDSPVPDAGTTALPPGALALAFEDVSFAYEDSTTNHRPLTTASPGADKSSSRSSVFSRQSSNLVLSGISFSLAPGQALGLLGRTGSGKTTIARLLFRFYDPQAGSIRLQGVNLRDLPLRALRRQIGMVTQEVQLFGASVRENVTLFAPGIPDERILSALDDLGLQPWLGGLPHGLDTELAAGGMSAGEGQLLAFARVFLQNPALVILDEASSRLDPATERLVGRATERLLRGRSAIIIAHRLATVERVDQILILDAGRVAEYGPRAALQADPGSRFAQLLRAGMAEALA